MYELVDLKQDYDNATFEKPRRNSICEKASDNFFLVEFGNTSIISLYMCESKK